MAQRGGWPHVVHGPYYGFPAFEDLADGTQREHALINPVQMDDVGFLEFRQTCYVVARIGDVDVEEMLFGEAHVPEDAPTLPQEMPLSEDGTGHLGHGDRLCLLIAHQHLGLNSIVVKGIHQTVGCYCGATGLLACIYYEYSHRLLVFIFDCMLARLDTAGRMQSYTCAKVMQFRENTKQKTLQNDKCH